MISQHLFTVGGAHANKEREREKKSALSTVGGKKKKENQTTSMVGSGHKKKKKWEKKAYNTRCSQAVTHPSTERARHCLTSVIRREPVYSVWYGRRHQNCLHNSYFYSLIFDGQTKTRRNTEACQDLSRFVLSTPCFRFNAHRAGSRMKNGFFFVSILCALYIEVVVAVEKSSSVSPTEDGALHFV